MNLRPSRFLSYNSCRIFVFGMFGLYFGKITTSHKGVLDRGAIDLMHFLGMFEAPETTHLCFCCPDIGFEKGISCDPMFARGYPKYVHGFEKGISEYLVIHVRSWISEKCARVNFVWEAR